MTIQISGVTLGNIGGGPSSLNLSDLHDVLIVAPQTSQYLRYNASIAEWQNSFITTDVYNYLDTNLTGSNGVALTKLAGPDLVDISLSLTATGDATGTVTGGALALTLSNTTVTAGTYNNPTIVVDSKGRITSASSGAAGGVTSFNTRTGPVVLTSTDVTTALTYVPYDSANPNGYTSNLGTVTSVGITSSNLTVASSPVTSSGTISIDLPTSGVTAGSYTNLNATIDAQGRITLASNGSSTADAGTLTGTTLAANVVNSSLTTVGVLSSLSLLGGATSPSVTGSTLPNNINIQPGSSGNPSNGGYGGSVGFQGGTSDNTGGTAYLLGGYGTLTGGSINIAGGYADTGGAGGYIEFGTHDPDLYVIRLRILSNGAWSVGSGYSDTGTPGQVLTSTGSTTPPTWQTVSSGSSGGFETTFLLMGA